MKASLIKWLEELRGSYWFLPSVMALGALCLAQGAIALDRNLALGWFGGLRWLAANDAEGARSVLSTVAGSMITVAGVTFSMTMVSVSSASAQFGPRLIGNFMRDRGNQLTLGTFIATFVYCLLLLRAVRGGEQGFVPTVSLMLAIGLTLCSVAVLIYFIHHVPETINISNITARLGGDLRRGVVQAFPCLEGLPVAERAATEREQRGLAHRLLHQGEALPSSHSGYLRALNLAGLLGIATELDLELLLVRRPGDFVAEGDPLLQVCGEGEFDDEVRGRLEGCFAFGAERSAFQNVLFEVDQLVEILARALSPGTNDPFTAMACLRWLGVSLRHIPAEDPRREVLVDREDRARLVLQPVTFEHFLDHLFERAVPYLRSDANAASCLLETLLNTAQLVVDPVRRGQLIEKGEQMVEAAREEGLPASDLERLERAQEELAALAPTD